VAVTVYNINTSGGQNPKNIAHGEKDVVEGIICEQIRHSENKAHCQLHAAKYWSIWGLQ